VAKVRERLAVNKEITEERFNHKKLNKVEGKDKYCVEVSNMFAALEDLDTEMNINSVWEMIM
jgi:hypothetical protein